MKIKIREIIILSIIGMLGYSCTYDTLPTPEVEVPDTVSHQMDLMPIYNANCNSSGCHAPGGPPPDLTEPAENAWSNIVFFGYVDTADAEGSLLYQKIAPGGSMERFASDEDRALILAWIEQGALFN